MEPPPGQLSSSLPLKKVTPIIFVEEGSPLSNLKCLFFPSALKIVLLAPDVPIKTKAFV